MDHSQHRSSPAGVRPNRYWPVLVGFLLIAGFFLWTEHRAHLLGALPFLIILACPLLHLFMHGGHGGHNGDSRP